MDAMELLNRINGMDEDQTPKAMIGAHLCLLNEEGDIINQLAECCIHKPVIRVSGTDAGFVVMDIDFDSDADSILSKMHSLFVKYSEAKTEEVVNPDNPLFVTLLITLLPVDGEHNGYIMAHNPVMHVLCASDIKRPVSCIRVLFRDENVVLYETESDLDFTPIDASVQMQAKQREDAMRRDEMRRQERMDILNHQNELLKNRRSTF